MGFVGSIKTKGFLDALNEEGYVKVLPLFP